MSRAAAVQASGTGAAPNTDLKERRAVANRHEKTARSFLGTIRLAAMAERLNLRQA